jgi:hypothetical protein
MIAARFTSIENAFVKGTNMTLVGNAGPNPLAGGRQGAGRRR